MSEFKPIKDASALFQHVNRLSSEAEWSETELRELFLEEGIDPSLFVQQVRAEVTRLLKESPHNWRIQARALSATLQRKMQSARRILTEGLPRKELLGHIETTLARMPPSLTEQFSFEHRNFEECTDEDLRSILEELEYISELNSTDAGE
jgi:hypothetical protein